MATAISIASPPPQTPSGPTTSAENATCIAPPPSRYQPVPAPPTRTAISIAPPPPPPSTTARTGHTHCYRNLYCTTPPQDQPVPAPPTGTAISPPPQSVSLPHQRQLRPKCRLPAEQLRQQPGSPRVVSSHQLTPPSTHGRPFTGFAVVTSTTQPPPAPNNVQMHLRPTQHDGNATSSQPGTFRTT